MGRFTDIVFSLSVAIVGEGALVGFFVDTKLGEGGTIVGGRSAEKRGEKKKP